MKSLFYGSFILAHKLITMLFFRIDTFPFIELIRRKLNQTDAIKAYFSLFDDGWWGMEKNCKHLSIICRYIKYKTLNCNCCLTNLACL